MSQLVRLKGKHTTQTAHCALQSVQKKGPALCFLTEVFSVHPVYTNLIEVNGQSTITKCRHNNLMERKRGEAA